MMRSRPRLAVISTHTSPLARAGTKKAGGMNVYITDLSHALAQAGWQIVVFTRRDRIDAPLIEYLEPGVRLFHIEAGPVAPLSPMHIAPYVGAFTEAVDRETAQLAPYDLIHSHYWLSGLSGIELARRWGVPHVTMFHTLGAVKGVFQQAEPELRIEGERRVVACSDLVIAATAHERAFLIGQYGAAAERVKVIPCGIDLARFHPIGREYAQRCVRRQLPQLGIDDGPGILFVGRLESAKGADLLVEALPLIESAEAPNLWIVGGDDRDAAERERLRQLATEHGVADRVRMVDAVGREQLPNLYRAATICAVPSAYESFGLVAVEAMASGTPVVATRVGGLVSTIRHERNGLLVEERQPEAFASALEQILVAPALQEQMSRAAATDMVDFSWQRVADTILDAYDELVDARRDDTPTDEPCCPDAVESLLAAAG